MESKGDFAASSARSQVFTQKPTRTTRTGSSAKGGQKLTRAVGRRTCLVSHRPSHFVSLTIAIRGYGAPTLITCGTFQLPSMIEGAVSLGQYIRSIRIKSPLGAGSQFGSLSAPGDSFWK
jgi:hypothetical protein